MIKFFQKIYANVRARREYKRKCFITFSAARSIDGWGWHPEVGRHSVCGIYWNVMAFQADEVGEAEESYPTREAAEKRAHAIARRISRGLTVMSLAEWRERQPGLLTTYDKAA